MTESLIKTIADIWINEARSTWSGFKSLQWSTLQVYHLPLTNYLIEKFSAKRAYAN